MLPAFAAARLDARAPQDPPGTTPAPAQGGDPDALRFATGRVTVGDLAAIELPMGWRFLAAADARRVLEELWHNPPDRSVLGLVFPPGGGPRESGLAVVVSYEEEGFVKDDDAAGLDYAALLQDMQVSTANDNAARRRAGYPEITLLGWAEPPHYDAGEKKLYWAKQLLFAGSSDAELNYDVRILGRGGYLVLTALATAPELQAVATCCQELLRATEFLPGKRYADFDPAYDKIAAYGIGGLIAGKVLLKAGLLKLLLKPLLIVGVLMAGVLGRLFGRRRRAVTNGPAAGD